MKPITKSIRILLLAVGLMLGIAVDSVHAQTLSVLYSFTGKTDGASPYSGVVFDKQGNLYGTANSGGDPRLCKAFGGCGVVFKLAPDGTETVLHGFTSVPDGATPAFFDSLLLDQDGSLYGTTSYGGHKVPPPPDIGHGTVFRVTQDGQETVLHKFLTTKNDGQVPSAGVIRNHTDGNLYGTTYGGGNVLGCGVVYRIDKAGKENIVHTFSCSDGQGPTNLRQDASGTMYGATTGGGTTGNGTVFKITTMGKFTMLYNFKGAPDGALPWAGVIVDKAGNLYGVTSTGGNVASCETLGCGVIYKVDKHGKETILHTLVNSEGISPIGVLAMDAKGNLYGTTFISGGTSIYGIIFKVTKNGQFSVLYNFTGGTDGGNPFAGVTLDSSGNLYGTTTLGGLIGKCDSGQGCGVVYKFVP